MPVARHSLPFSAEPEPPADDAVGEAGILARVLKLAVTAIVITGLYFGQTILVPFALAALMSFVLDPMAGLLRRAGLPRSLAVAAVMLIVSLVMAGSVLFAARQVIDLGTGLPAYQDTIERKVRGLRETVSRHATLGQASRVLDAVEDELAAARSLLATPSRQRAPMRVEVAEATLPPLQAMTRLFGPIVGPLTTLGLVLVFVVFILLERNDLRDRFLRVIGGDLTRTTDALNDAAQRVSRYLTMQLLVNLGYGIALACGLWWIGTPGALLWGFLAAVLRFIPYLGPVVAGAFPLLLGFAVDPGWQMLLWTVGLLAVLELLINNVVEPWAYGSSTGMAPVAIVISAAFWTLLWGPIGLILATPLTVCLVVLGRHLPHLGFLEVMFGNEPVFDAPTRLYQRLIAGNVEEAIELAHDETRQVGVVEFLSRTALPALKMGACQVRGLGNARHRHRFHSGMGSLLRDLARERAPLAGPGRPRVLCAGTRSEADTLLAGMLQETLHAGGVVAGVLPPAAIAADRWETLDLDGVELLCLCALSPEPCMQLRYLCRQARRRNPGIRLLAFCPSLADGEPRPELLSDTGADRLAIRLAEAGQAGIGLLAAPGGDDAGKSSGEGSARPEPAASGTLQDLLSMAAHRVVDVFEVSTVLLSLNGASSIAWIDAGDGLRCRVWREPELPAYFAAAGQTCCVDDTSEHAALAGCEGLRAAGLRFCAGTPLRDGAGQLIGSLCILAAEPRRLREAERELLEELAAGLMLELQDEQDRSRALMALCSSSPPQGGEIAASFAVSVQGGL